MNNKVVKNASWIIVCRVVQSILSMIIGMFSARYLGPSNYGIINYAASVTSFLVPFAQLGIRNILVNEIIKKPDKEGNILGSSLVMCMVSSVLGIIGVVSFVSIVNTSEKETIIVCFLYSISLLFQATEMLQYWFQAKYLSKYTAITSLAVYVVVMFYKLFLLISGKSIIWFAITNSLDYFLISISLYIIYRKLNGQKLYYSKDTAKSLFSISKYYIISSMMVTIFSQTDTIMIKNIVGNEENGFYSAALTCANASNFVFLAIIDSFRPLISENKKISEDKYQNSIVRLYSIVFYLALLQSLAFLFVAPLVVSVLYGKAYSASIPILRTVTWFTAFAYMGTVRNIWILVEDKQKILWIINLCGALSNVLLNAILIPIMGALGAAIASVTTQFFTNFVLCFLIPSIRPTGKLIIKSINPMVITNMLKKRKI